MTEKNDINTKKFLTIKTTNAYSDNVFNENVFWERLKYEAQELGYGQIKLTVQVHDGKIQHGLVEQINKRI